MIVVICLKNRTFAVSQTSVFQEINSIFQLWFAWKIVLLQYHKHQQNTATTQRSCCDLLEKSYFCSITNITRTAIAEQVKVVICLKNRTFAVSQTSRIWGQSLSSRLWFAWKIVLLQYHKHLQIGVIACLFFVICLKNSTFAVSQTSCHKQMSITMALWFAWKIVLLQYHKHPYLRFAKTSIGCDLLEKSYFCSITNIPLRHFVPHYAVVICLKNRTFAVSQTSIQQ